MVRRRLRICRCFDGPLELFSLEDELGEVRAAGLQADGELGLKWALDLRMHIVTSPPYE